MYNITVIFEDNMFVRSVLFGKGISNSKCYQILVFQLKKCNLWCLKLLICLQSHCLKYYQNLTEPEFKTGFGKTISNAVIVANKWKSVCEKFILTIDSNLILPFIFYLRSSKRYENINIAVRNFKENIEITTTFLSIQKVITKLSI